MNSTIKRILISIIIISMLVLMLTACGQDNSSNGKDEEGQVEVKTHHIDMGTATSGGGFYTVGTSIAGFLNEKVGGLKMKAMVSGGTVDNVNLLERKEIESALAVAGFAYLAYHGEDQWEGRPQENLRGISYLFDSVFHFVARKDSGIEKLEDLRGRKGSPGALASGNEKYTEQVLAELDIDYKNRNDLIPEYTDNSGAADLMKDGHIQWAALPVGIPGAVVMDVANTVNINILPVEGEFRERFLEKYPYYVEAVIPAGTYKGVDEDVQSAAAPSILIADESMDEELVYQITKAIYENLDEFKAIHNSLNGMTPEKATSGIAIPLHPGAERYYKEAGIL